MRYQQNNVSDLEDSLNRLYRAFQDEYVENPEKGKVFAISHTHIVCNGYKHAHIVNLDELYALENESNKEDIQSIRTFTTLLPWNVTFYILHYPKMHDVFVISYGDKAEL